MRREVQEGRSHIEGDKEGARYVMRERGNDFGVFFQGLLFSENNLKDAS